MKVLYILVFKEDNLITHALYLAILCASLYTIIKKGGGINDQRMQYNDLLHEIIFLSSMLKIEMIYKPGGVEANMQRALDWLIEHKVLQMSDDGWIGLSDEERSCGRENYGRLSLYES